MSTRSNQNAAFKVARMLMVYGSSAKNVRKTMGKLKRSRYVPKRIQKWITNQVARELDRIGSLR